MSRIEAGQDAPEFALPSTTGKRFTLSEALQRGPTVVVFFKISCPTCEFTFPFLERLFKAYGGESVSFLGISQDDPKATREFCTDAGVTFPALVDGDGYPASNDYGITNVPSYYLISPDGRVQVSSVGFSKEALEQISARLAGFLNQPTQPVFLPDEIIPDTKAGCGSKN
jgi:peroxiredoxin